MKKLVFVLLIAILVFLFDSTMKFFEFHEVTHSIQMAIYSVIVVGLVVFLMQKEE